MNHAPTRHFEIGVVRASLTTPLHGVMEEYASLYDRHARDAAHPRSIHVAVRPQGFSAFHRRRFEVSVNGRLQFTPGRVDEILPHVEWAVNWEVPRAMPEHLQLHASSLERDGVGVIFPGDSGCGKSTLAVGLIARGWRYLCDEFALIDARTLMLQPYPRAICIKKPSYPVVESLGIPIRGRRHYLKGSKGYVVFLKPSDLHPDAIGRSCPIRYVIFPQYTPGAAPALTPMTRPDAVLALHRVCFNLLNCQTLGLEVLTSMIREAACYRLVSGEIGRTCDLLDELIPQPSREHLRPVMGSFLALGARLLNHSLQTASPVRE